ncbi:DM13 domain-containing protein [Winogradskyella immobilis]|uniref:DM13 domain-containing protein n=1 Tax=Winogradskyella immobilis TaxID=2816852 RepID=A0ABS8EJP2_9FLAO|nr:DM13 domain-containing protein [Winogradskyella immobilis]MCC1483082.1 DM13 domain-containing protein [Winogradskyella immobilis]MCG0015177.1 DM13 domain-containing protein [Winogradskyella immobilis]
MKNTILLFALLITGIASLNAQTTHSGKWEADSYFVSFKGSWKIVKEDAKTYVVMGDDFSAKKGPDLKIFLSKLNLKDIDGDNASAKGQSVFIAELKSFKGTNKYLIPSNINVSDYKTILVHCEKYAKFWGGAPLNK